MEVINSAGLFGVYIEVREDEFIPLPKKETWEMYLDNYDGSMKLLKGALIGSFFCLPFWIILFCLIT